jgi:hypothetical protein
VPAVPDVPHVVLHVWRVRSPARALLRMGTDGRRLAGSGAGFVKLLGTAGSGFGLRDADLHRWALLTTWTDPVAADALERHPVVRGWDASAVERARLVLAPLSTVGRWDGVEPFGAPATDARDLHDGPVLAITRARLHRRTSPRFRRSVPPVAAELAASPGLLVSFGVGERPVGLLGTCSVWQDEASLLAFARRAPAHVAVARASRGQDWFAEELFSRFAVTAAEGVLDGRPVPQVGAPRPPSP